MQRLRRERSDFASILFFNLHPFSISNYVDFAHIILFLWSTSSQTQHYTKVTQEPSTDEDPQLSASSSTILHGIYYGSLGAPVFRIHFCIFWKVTFLVTFFFFFASAWLCARWFSNVRNFLADLIGRTVLDWFSM